MCSCDRVLLFDAKRPTVHNFAVQLAASLKDPSTLPFELRVLEAVLDDVCNSFDRHCRRLQPIVGAVTEHMAQDVGEDSLNRLLPLKNAMTSFEYRVKEAGACCRLCDFFFAYYTSSAESAVNTLLENDEDMAMLFLTARHATGADRPASQHIEVRVSCHR